jgi:hypothetical protein
MRDGVERMVWSRWLTDGEALPFRGGYLGNCDRVQGVNTTKISQLIYLLGGTLPAFVLPYDTVLPGGALMDPVVMRLSSVVLLNTVVRGQSLTGRLWIRCHQSEQRQRDPNPNNDSICQRW